MSNKLYGATDGMDDYERAQRDHCLSTTRKKMYTNLGVTSLLSALGAVALRKFSPGYRRIHWRMRTIAHVALPMAYSYAVAESYMTKCAHADYEEYAKWKSY